MQLLAETRTLYVGGAASYETVEDSFQHNLQLVKDLIDDADKHDTDENNGAENINVDSKDVNVNVVGTENIGTSNVVESVNETYYIDSYDEEMVEQVNTCFRKKLLTRLSYLLTLINLLTYTYDNLLTYATYLLMLI